MGPLRAPWAKQALLAPDAAEYEAGSGDREHGVRSIRRFRWIRGRGTAAAPAQPPTRGHREAVAPRAGMMLHCKQKV